MTQLSLGFEDLEKMVGDVEIPTTDKIEILVKEGELPPPPHGHDQWGWIVINTSAGKDSQTAMRQTLLAADAVGFPRERIVASHQCLGKMEWPGTLDLAKLQCQIHGLELFVSKYRNEQGEELDLLEYINKRGKWPDSKNRFCTSDFKRGPGDRILTQLSKRHPGPILSVFGFRAEESPARKKKIVFKRNERTSRQKRPVWEWLPIHKWSVTQVWDDIHQSGVPYHHAYDLGMGRLSCVFCVFAPESALLIAGKHNPQLLDEYCETEEATGHDFQHNKPIRAIREKLRNGIKAQIAGESWIM